MEPRGEGGAKLKGEDPDTSVGFVVITVTIGLAGLLVTTIAVGKLDGNPTERTVGLSLLVSTGRAVGNFVMAFSAGRAVGGFVVIVTTIGTESNAVGSIVGATTGCLVGAMVGAIPGAIVGALVGVTTG